MALSRFPYVSFINREIPCVILDGYTRIVDIDIIFGFNWFHVLVVIVLYKYPPVRSGMLRVVIFRLH